MCKNCGLNLLHCCHGKQNDNNVIIGRYICSRYLRTYAQNLFLVKLLTEVDYLQYNNGIMASHHWRSIEETYSQQGTSFLMTLCMLLKLLLTCFLHANWCDSSLALFCNIP